MANQARDDQLRFITDGSIVRIIIGPDKELFYAQADALRKASHFVTLLDKAAQNKAIDLTAEPPDALKDLIAVLHAQGDLAAYLKSRVEFSRIPALLVIAFKFYALDAMAALYAVLRDAKPSDFEAMNWNFMARTLRGFRSQAMVKNMIPAIREVHGQHMINSVRCYAAHMVTESKAYDVDSLHAHAEIYSRLSAIMTALANSALDQPINAGMTPDEIYAIINSILPDISAEASTLPKPQSSASSSERAKETGSNPALAQKHNSATPASRPLTSEERTKTPSEQAKADLDTPARLSTTSSYQDSTSLPQASTPQPQGVAATSPPLADSNHTSATLQSEDDQHKEDKRDLQTPKSTPTIAPKPEPPSETPTTLDSNTINPPKASHAPASKSDRKATSDKANTSTHWVLFKNPNLNTSHRNASQSEPGNRFRHTNWNPQTPFRPSGGAPFVCDVAETRQTIEGYRSRKRKASGTGYLDSGRQWRDRGV